MEKLRKLYLWLNKKESGFSYDTKWLWRFYLLFGLMPITKNSSGRMQFKFWSWAMLYSVIIYMYCTFLSIKYIVIKRIHILMTLLDDYDSFIYNIMFLLFMKTQFFCPIAGWFSAKGIADYHNAWISFEENFEKKLNQKLCLKSLDTFSKRVIFLNLSASLSMIIGQKFTLPTYTLYEGIGYISPLCGYALFNSLIIINYSAIEMASDSLMQKLKKALHPYVTQDVIISFKRLWIDLSNLTQLVGDAFSTICTVCILAVFIDLTTSGYGYLVRFVSRMKSKNDHSLITMEEFGMIVAFFISLYLIVVCSNCAYSATNKVEQTFIDVLCVAATKPYHPKVTQEIDLFLLAITADPPIISLGGYVNLDRKFITKVLSTIMTYLIVLMQFKVGFNQIE